MLFRGVVAILAAILLSLASLRYVSAGDEYAQYGNVGAPSENWRPRVVAGWSAPFMADDPGTSVIGQIGLEDDFRPGSFVGTCSFWLWIVIASWQLGRRLRGARGQARRSS